jgi:PAS domain S-box-containing protein
MDGRGQDDFRHGTRPERVGALMDTLLQTERKLIAAARLACLGYWEDDLVANRLSWSDETRHVLGLPPGDRERTWHDFRKLVGPDDRPIVDAARVRVLGGTRAVQVAFRTALPGGTRHLEIVAEPIQDQHGQITRVVGAIQDVSDRKKAEAELRGSAERLQLALQASGLGPWDWDLTTNVVEFWPEWKRQLGLRTARDFRPFRGMGEPTSP